MAQRKVSETLHRALDAILDEYPSGYALTDAILDVFENHVPYMKDGDREGEHERYSIVVDLRKIVLANKR